MTLAPLFYQHRNREPPEPEALVAMEDALLQLLKAGRARWPQLQISAEEFVYFLALQLPAGSIEPAELRLLRGDELYLLRALGLGHSAALLVFETEYMPEVRRTLLRIGSSDAQIADIIQTLYDRLLERQNTEQGSAVNRQGYAGRGELKGWLCTCAVRLAWRLLKRGRQEAELWQAPTVLLPDQGKSPDQTLLTGELKELFETAFREAVAALTSRERNLLRYHFLSGLSIDQVGVIYRVHRATAARWLVQAREQLAIHTRKRFLAAAPAHASSFTEILELVRSQLSLNLTSLLKSVPPNLLG